MHLHNGDHCGTHCPCSLGCAWDVIVWDSPSAQHRFDVVDKWEEKGASLLLDLRTGYSFGLQHCSLHLCLSLICLSGLSMDEGSLVWHYGHFG